MSVWPGLSVLGGEVGRDAVIDDAMSSPSLGTCSGTEDYLPRCGLRRNQAMLGRQKSPLIYPGRPVSTNPVPVAGRLWHRIGAGIGREEETTRRDEERRTIKISFSPGLHSPRDGAWRSWRPLARKRPSLRALAINVLHMPPMQAHWARLHLSAVERVRDSNGNDVSTLPPSCHHSWLSPARRRLQAL